ncbi:hypothetical protein SAMN04488516_101260 [Desulfonauticus submarinus]|uniref:Uncharacterized protein n=1 Tax=Desulfonauticus submarinus TaxID=206665 RepID=A0A1H0A2Z4_9BACT|nr:hypothetical protein [Desulfonauticus submarinus]SDN27757.1 hypothetical protein SAMN04488516_101260 [Desulfonauticus submarinus]
MLLSETDLGKKYIEQFDREDQQIAKKFIDSLIIISEHRFLNELSTALDELTKHSTNLPAALYPVFEKKKNTSSFFQEDGTPHMSEASHVGSEGILQKFCRDYATSKKNVYFNLSLKELKEKKIRSIICVDDIIASGKRMREFIEWIYGNKTIKSWYSFKWIKFLIVTYAVTEKGLKGNYLYNNDTKTNAERKKRSKDIIRTLNIIPDEQIKFNIKLNDGRSFWISKDKNEIIRLCYKYAKKYNIPEKWILGFNKTFSTIIFPHSVPNTTPGIIWWGKNQKWKPLFPKNVFPAQIIDLTRLNLSKVEESLKKLGFDDNKFNFDAFLKAQSEDSKRLFLFLLCLSKKKRRISIISEVMELPIIYVEKLRDKCLEYNLITSNLILTKQGRNILKSIKKHMKKSQENICIIKEEYYYPMSLRGLTALSSKTTSLENGGRNDC